MSDTLADLTAARALYFSWLLWSAAVVALGVTMEGPEVIKEAAAMFRKNAAEEKAVEAPGRPKWVTMLALVGWIFVALGVAGEAVCESLVSHADAQIEALNDKRLAEATAEAGSAKTSAIQAAEAASSAGVSTTGAKREADEAKGLAHTAHQEAETVQNKLAAANKFLESMAPRYAVINKHRDEFLNALDPYPGQKVEVEQCRGLIADVETSVLADDIVKFLMSASWDLHGTIRQDCNWGYGLEIEARDGSSVQTIDAANALAAIITKFLNPKLFKLHSTLPKSNPNYNRFATIVPPGLLSFFPPIPPETVKVSVLAKPPIDQQ